MNEEQQSHSVKEFKCVFCGNPVFMNTYEQSLKGCPVCIECRLKGSH